MCRRKRTLKEKSTTTKPNASLTTSLQTLSPGDYLTSAGFYLRRLACSTIYIFFVHFQENHLGGGEENEHRNIWSSRPLTERQRRQRRQRTQRAEHP